MKTVVLFYKVLEAAGGAERLLLHEYHEFKKLGYDVKILTYRFNKEAFFSQDIDVADLIIISGNAITSLLRLRKYLCSKTEAIVLGSSGHIDLFLATFGSGINYSLHVHHPSYMSFNEYDKYSFFQLKHFSAMLKSNFGASRFNEIYQSLSVIKKIKINARAAISIASIKKAKNIFVLSGMAKKEKKLLFGVEAHVVCGAIDTSVLKTTPKSRLSFFDGFDHKFLTLARLDINKRIDVLLDAFGEYLKLNSNSLLVIGGEGEEKKNLIIQANKLGIQDHVRFLGFVADEDLYDLYASADVFVSIDWADYRITAYEALAMGTKVILSDETDFGKDLQGSGYLKLVEPTMEQTLKAMSDFISEEPKMTIDEFRSKHLTELTWTSFAKRLLSHLE